MQIDVTELFTDPDVGNGPFQVIRRPETVNSKGEGIIAESLPVAAVGSVYPASRNALVREEAYSTGQKSITVVTTFPLRLPTKVGDQSYQADLVLWKGDRYIVRELKDYTQYGTGFVEADCISIPFVDKPPQSPMPAVGAFLFNVPGQSGLIGVL